ncbi:MAG: hypothetical protein NVS9B10_15340 [Nevskia sp.]
MHIVVNGEPYEAPDAVSVDRLLGALHLQGQRLAIELNGSILPRRDWDGRCLSKDDRIEIVRAIGGG